MWFEDCLVAATEGGRNKRKGEAKSRLMEKEKKEGGRDGSCWILEREDSEKQLLFISFSVQCTVFDANIYGTIKRIKWLVFCYTMARTVFGPSSTVFCPFPRFSLSLRL